MSSYEIDAIYELLLKRHREKGFLNPNLALDSEIRGLMNKGRTREEAIRELYSTDTPWTYSPTTPSSDSMQEKATAEDTAVLWQIAKLKEKIDSLTTLFSNGKISEETYTRGVKRIEENIGRLQQEHKIPIVERRERASASISRYPRYDSREEIYEDRHYHGSPDRVWYLVPFFFGILGGIVAYVAVKDDAPEMADNLLAFGIFWTVVLFILGWVFLFH